MHSHKRKVRSVEKFTIKKNFVKKTPHRLPIRAPWVKFCHRAGVCHLSARVPPPGEKGWNLKRPLVNLLFLNYLRGATFIFDDLVFSLYNIPQIHRFAHTSKWKVSFFISVFGKKRAVDVGIVCRELAVATNHVLISDH